MNILIYLKDKQRKDFQTLLKKKMILWAYYLKGKGVHSPELIMRMRMKRPIKTTKIKAENFKSA